MCVHACVLNAFYIMSTGQGIVVTGKFQLSLGLGRDYMEALTVLTL